MSIPWKDAVEHFEARVAQSRDLAKRYDLLKDTISERLTALEEHLQKARLALAAAYLPELTPAGLARAERLTGFRAFSRRDPLKAMDQRKAALEKAVARIAADPRYQRRIGLVGPGGELTEKLKEIKEMTGPFEAECSRFEEQPMFKELYQAGYDTPRFSVSWWKGDYWKMWAAGDRICAALKLNDFGDDVLPAYEAAVKERTFWQEETQRMGSLIQAVHTLTEEHDRAVAILPRLGEVILEECWGVLTEFFGHADEALLDGWLRKEPEEAAFRPIQLALKRVAGQAAKRTFLLELRDQGIKVLITSLGQREQKDRQKLRKLTTSSKMIHQPVLPSFLDPDFAAKGAKLAGQADGLERQIEKLMRAEKFERFELTNHSNLWWTHFTGRPPPRLMPKVRGWYDRNPKAVVAVTPGEVRSGAPDDPALTAAAVAMVVGDPTAGDASTGYLS